MPVSMQDRIGESIGSFLRHVMPGRRSAYVKQSGEVFFMRGGWRHDGYQAVALRIDDDGRHRDRRLLGDLGFQFIAGRVACHQPVAVPVGVDDNVDEVGVFE